MKDAELKADDLCHFSSNDVILMKVAIHEGW